MTHRILILGGTTEARQLAGKLARRKDFSITLSLAGRTESPMAQGVPMRSGGFGGMQGLAAYLHREQVDLVVDATHPYAARMSANAAEAARQTRVPMVALRRAGWEPVAGDRWTFVESVAEAAKALGTAPRRVLLAIGRQEAGAFEAAPQHRYLIRSVDPIEPKLAVPDAVYLLARGPFPEADERALLEKYAIDTVVSKNSGGEATYGKIAAARAVGIELIMVRRPPLPDVASAETVDQLAAMVDHFLDPVAERGV
ncbi:MAG: cobalt-precorrin-6A reductase [Mesorhizobium sp.]|uniref:cobalt-precorrin-6A reductase n=1 Tax=Mesorhizobium sp. TaxID=1871066 RepID=UPI000FE8B995|nr:cobalt-precorrin-6A reductase [Mesorhizobium sp.]RWG60639.1 MAG: cobalt-precorrin-6A reductase [Mesorhizobium sp.]RWH44892.1 MAG: cobalt-precorrin-6A reductase [Mesorhizobium sp.]